MFVQNHALKSEFKFLSRKICPMKWYSNTNWRFHRWNQSRPAYLIPNDSFHVNNQGNYEE